MTAPEQALEKQLEILRLALQNEIETRAFYLRAQETVKSEKARDMFSSLANDERTHEELLASQAEALQEGSGWMVPTAADDPDYSPEDLPARMAVVEADVHPEDSDLDAVSYGLRLEINSHTFYSDAAKQADVEEARSLYDQLARMERRHFEILYLQYEDLVRTGPITGYLESEA